MTNPAAQKDSCLRELASHTQRTAVAPDRELAEHLELIERQLPTIGGNSGRGKRRRQRDTVMRIRSADVETLWDGLKYRYQTGCLPRWRFRAARVVYLAAAALLRRLAA